MKTTKLLLKSTISYVLVLSLLFIGVILLLFPMHADAYKAKTRISIAVFEEHYQLIIKIYQEVGCTDKAIDYDPTNQMVTEFIILCQALQVAGDKYRLVPVPFPLHKRVFQQLYKGQIAVSGMGMWLNDADINKVHLSMPLIRSREFSKGLYYNPKNQKVIDNLNSFPFNNLDAVINTNWQIDYQSLKCAGFTVAHADRYKAMFRMVEKGRVDIVPHAFTHLPKMQLEKGQQTLIPIPGYKIEFDNSLHFFISKKHQLAEALNQDINTGLKILRDKGVISKIYQKLGIIRPETASWITINCA